MTTLLSLDEIILAAQKPSRYVGCEFGSIRKDPARVRLRFALAFPDTYEVGMSNLGFRLLYHALNDRPDVACERVFLPWPDMEAMLRENRHPLFTLESRSPVRDLDVVGVTLQTELAFTSVLAMLDLSGIPLLTRDRGAADPVVVGGGPCAFNPEPVADFFDALAVGDGEDVVHEIADAVLAWKGSGEDRAGLHRRLSRVPGVYVPSLFAPRFDPATGALLAMDALEPGYETVVRRVVADIDTLSTSAYERPVVPFMQTVHDRLPIELQRGCTRGCRFCQVGMITRPTRQRSPETVLRVAEQGLRASGYEEVGLLSLSSGDYASLNPLLDDFLSRYESERVSLSLPSLRTETMNDALAEKIARVRKTGFTLAPEAATERMRAVINKGNREEDLLAAVESIFKNGWSLLKLYFMIGLPEERDEDVVAIARLAKRCLSAARRALPPGKGSVAINLGASTFVPKPFTPFQWEPMITPEETRRRQALVTAELGGRSGAISFKPHDSRAAAIEGALALGDRRVGTAVLHAFRLGQRLDGWSEWFDEGRWMEAFAEMERVHGVGLPWFVYRRRRMDEVLPWDRIDCGVTKPYLQKQLAAARNLAEVPDCVLAPCSVCGACDYDAVKNRIHLPRGLREGASASPRAPGDPGPDPRPGPVCEGGEARRPLPPRGHARRPAVGAAGGIAGRLLPGVSPETAGLLRASPPGRGRQHRGIPRLGARGTPRACTRRGRSRRGPARGADLPRRPGDRRQGAFPFGVRARGPLSGRIPAGLERGGALPENRRFSFGGPVGGAQSRPTKGPREEEKPEIRGTEVEGDRSEGDGDPPVGRWTRAGRVQLEGGSIGKRQASRGAGGRVRRWSATQRSQGLEGRCQLRAGGGCAAWLPAAIAALRRRLSGNEF